MAGFLLPVPMFRARTVRGVPLASGSLHAYAAGTSRSAATYADGNLSTSLTVPIALNSRGEAAVFLAGLTGYKVVVRDQQGAAQYTQDNVAVPDVAAAVDQNMPAGVVLPCGMSTVPSGFLPCDGAAVSRSTYASLFAALGTTWGVGDGSSTFNVPDLRGRFPLGKAGSGTAGTLGVTGGTLDHSHDLPSHTHPVTGGAHTHTVSQNGWGQVTTLPDPAGTLLAQASGVGVPELAANGVTTSSGGDHTHTMGAASVTSSTGNPAFRVVEYMVKA